MPRPFRRPRPARPRRARASRAAAGPVSASKTSTRAPSAAAEGTRQRKPWHPSVPFQRAMSSRGSPATMTSQSRPSTSMATRRGWCGWAGSSSQPRISGCGRLSTAPSTARACQNAGAVSAASAAPVAASWTLYSASAAPRWDSATGMRRVSPGPSGTAARATTRPLRRSSSAGPGPRARGSASHSGVGRTTTSSRSIPRRRPCRASAIRWPRRAASRSAVNSAIRASCPATTSRAASSCFPLAASSRSRSARVRRVASSCCQVAVSR